jgi:hypothetical protein
MIQPKIQEVLTHEQPNDNYVIVHLEESKLYLQKACTFTPEEFETFKREFGKELLEKAADNAKLGYDRVLWDDPKEGDDAYMNIPKVDKESITSVLDDYLLNNKI